MNKRLDTIRANERESHIEIYKKEKLYKTKSWLGKPVKTIEEYDISDNTYDFIMAVSALEHIDTQESFIKKLREIEKRVRKNGM